MCLNLVGNDSYEKIYTTTAMLERITVRKSKLMLSQKIYKVDIFFIRHYNKVVRL